MLELSSPDSRLTVYEFTITRRCHFKRKPDVDGKRRLGCERCGLPKLHPDHLGGPPSLNMFGSGAQRVFQAQKKTWQQLLTSHLYEVGLPKPCQRIVVEGTATFPDRGRRDQGNYRFLLEKALGDALTAGGWLEDDDWARYEFGNLAYAYEKGVSSTTLRLYPMEV